MLEGHWMTDAVPTVFEGAMFEATCVTVYLAGKYVHAGLGLSDDVTDSLMRAPDGVM